MEPNNGNDKRGDPRNIRQGPSTAETTTKGCGCSIITIVVLLPIVIALLVIAFGR